MINVEEMLNKSCTFVPWYELSIPSELITDKVLRYEKLLKKTISEINTETTSSKAYVKTLEENLKMLPLRLNGDFYCEKYKNYLKTIKTKK